MVWLNKSLGSQVLFMFLFAFTCVSCRTTNHPLPPSKNKDPLKVPGDTDSGGEGPEVGSGGTELTDEVDVDIVAVFQTFKIKSPTAGKVTWQKADAACKEMAPKGKWFLPSRQQLDILKGVSEKDLLDENRAPLKGLLGASGERVWTSDKQTGGSTKQCASKIDSDQCKSGDSGWESAADATFRTICFQFNVVQ
jgi:hypothetical protein